MFVGFEPASNSREFTYGSNVILKKLSSHYSFFADENSRGLVQTVKFGGKVRCVFMIAFRHRLFNAPKIAQTGASPFKFATFCAYPLQDFRHHVFAGFRCGFALSDGYVF